MLGIGLVARAGDRDVAKRLGREVAHVGPRIRPLLIEGLSAVSSFACAQFPHTVSKSLYISKGLRNVQLHISRKCEIINSMHAGKNQAPPQQSEDKSRGIQSARRGTAVYLLSTAVCIQRHQNSAESFFPKPIPMACSVLCGPLKGE